MCDFYCENPASVNGVPVCTSSFLYSDCNLPFSYGTETLIHRIFLHSLQSTTQVTVAFREPPLKACVCVCVCVCACVCVHVCAMKSITLRGNAVPSSQRENSRVPWHNLSSFARSLLPIRLPLSSSSMSSLPFFCLPALALTHTHTHTLFLPAHKSLKERLTCQKV